MIRLYNTLTRQIEEFTPQIPKHVKIYTCGPTVYDYQHIGNYSGYIYWDTLVRLFLLEGYSVERVINITDVGHLVSDSDEGEDKLEKGAKRDGKTAREVADYFTEDFFKNAERLNFIKPKLYAKATDYIAQQQDIINLLLKKGYAYQTEQAIYFATNKLTDYGKLTGQKLEDKEIGARDSVVTDEAKHHPQDFALWFFTVGRFDDHEMHWASPWGDGFPGWHLECSAIIHSTLEESIDIHAGGIDHIGTHHTNEIAQSEAAFDKPLSKLWLHNNHMSVDGKKISKSLNNGYTIDDLLERGYTTDDFRMLVLQSHYRSQSKFTWESLDATRANLQSFINWADLTYQDTQKANLDDEELLKSSLVKALNDDLNTPQALAALNMFDLSLAPSKGLLQYIDSLFGFSLGARPDITDDQKRLIDLRNQARDKQDWESSDQLRFALAKEGVELNDGSRETTWQRQS